MVWDGCEFDREDKWISRFSEQECSLVRAAVDRTRKIPKPLGELTRDDFRFEDVGQRLLSLRDTVLEGRGFTVLRGLARHDWSDEDLIRAYWGIGKWLGDPVSQNASAHLLGHIIDQRKTLDPGIRIYQTSLAQPFHSDSCDMVGLLCLRPAMRGGASSIASSAAIHNALLDRDPTALEHLYSTFQCDRFGEVPEGKQPSYPVRIFNEVHGNMVCCGMDPDIRSAQRLDEVDRLTAEQVHALDAFQQMARKLSLRMNLERGDMQFLNNLTVVHARESFEDYPEPERRRYLVRLWLSSPRGRVLPEFLAERWGNIEVGSVRGGILVPGAKPMVSLDPDR